MTAISPPPLRSPMINADGSITQVWQMWFTTVAGNNGYISPAINFTDAGMNSFITSTPTIPTLPIVGFALTLPSVTAVINGISVTLPALQLTLNDNSVYDVWGNDNGSYKIENQLTINYPALPHHADKLHVWQITTQSGNIVNLVLFGNTYPTPARPFDTSGTIDNFAEIFYMNTVTTNWSAGTSVTYGELLLTTDGNVYQVKFPGTTGSSKPTGQASGVISDGTAQLYYYSQGSYLGMFRESPNGGTEYYFTNIGLEQVVHKTLLTDSPLGVSAGTTMASLVKNHIKGVFKHLILNRVNSGTYAFQMKMIAGGYIWLNTTVAGGTAAGSSPFSGSYTPGVSTVTDGGITWLCIAVSYASQFAFWMDVDRTFLTYRSPDSHDSYASTFASLVARYVGLTGDYSWLNGASLQPSGSGTYWSYYVLFDTIISQNLDQQLSNFLTKTFQYNTNPLDGSSFSIQYLEDNCESVKGYGTAAYVYGVLGQTTRQTSCLSNQAYVGFGVDSLYDQTYNLCATHYGEDVSTWANNPNIGWYPYLQAQFFPELCGVPTFNNDQFKLLRYNVSTRWPSYFQDKALDAFPNMSLGYMAAKFWQDTAKASSFIEKMERYYITGGTVAQGALTLAGNVTINEWGYYLAIKDALIPPLTLLNTNGNTINFLNQQNNVVPYTYVPPTPPAPVEGTFTLNGTSIITVTDAGTTPYINITLKTSGGTIGADPTIKSVTPGTGFTVTGTALDTSTYSYKCL